MPHIKKLNFSNPVGLYDPRANGYSHLAQFPAGWRIITPAGQGGETANTELSPDFRTQFAQAVENTRTVLAAAGATLEDIAKINSSSTMTEEVDADSRANSGARTYACRDRRDRGRPRRTASRPTPCTLPAQTVV